MRVLGIETSCDETGVALYDDEGGILAENLFSQIDLHAEFGGVVPELASRDHVQRLLPMIEKTLREGKTEPAQLDAIAYTSGPGLVGALLVGATLAKTLGYVWDLPTVPIHHMEAHLLAPLLEEQPPEVPFVALLVSGGHTQLVAVRALGDYQLLGESLDDAAGEAFDKAAKMMGLPYPGGPSIAKAAKRGRAGMYQFPRPMVDRPGLDFSFSGLKTFTLNTVAAAKAEEDGLSEQKVADIAYAFQDAVVETLVIKCRRAMQQTGFRTLVMAGGVAANEQLRQRLAEAFGKHRWQLCYPRQAFCTDNGAMVAYAGALRARNLDLHQRGDLSVRVTPRVPLDQLPTIHPLSNAGV